MGINLDETELRIMANAASPANLSLLRSFGVCHHSDKADVIARMISSAGLHVSADGIHGYNGPGAHAAYTLDQIASEAKGYEDWGPGVYEMGPEIEETTIRVDPNLGVHHEIKRTGDVGVITKRRETVFGTQTSTETRASCGGQASIGARGRIDVETGLRVIDQPYNLLDLFTGGARHYVDDPVNIPYPDTGHVSGQGVTVRQSDQAVELDPKEEAYLRRVKIPFNKKPYDHTQDKGLYRLAGAIDRSVERAKKRLTMGIIETVEGIGDLLSPAAWRNPKPEEQEWRVLEEKEWTPERMADYWRKEANKPDIPQEEKDYAIMMVQCWEGQPKPISKPERDCTLVKEPAVKEKFVRHLGVISVRDKAHLEKQRNLLSRPEHKKQKQVEADKYLPERTLEPWNSDGYGELTDDFLNKWPDAATAKMDDYVRGTCDERGLKFDQGEIDRITSMMLDKDRGGEMNGDLRSGNIYKVFDKLNDTSPNGVSF